LQRESQPHIEKNIFVRLFSKFVPMQKTLEGEKFIVKKNGRRFATPLLLALVAIEATDVVFAVDSIPAIFAVTADPFIVYTSNIFAILGLRSLYFLLGGIIDKFLYLKVGLAFVLGFVGVKMLIVDFYKIPIAVSLAAIVTILGGSIVASLAASRRSAGAPPPVRDNNN
jgi:tellurite resistance protein TerC